MSSISSSVDVSLSSTFENITNISNNHAAQDKKPDPFVDKIMSLYLKHNWSLVALEDVMDLLNENREVCDKFPTAKKQIIKLFRQYRDLVDIFYFVNCDKCKAITKINSENTSSMKCTRCATILKTTETNFFVSMPIEQQIKESVKKNWSYISKFDTSGNDHSYTDAHDGKILKDILKKYGESEVNILSLCLNIDGANKFKSNSVSIWPIQLTQKFLPPSIRFLPSNIIVTGLHYRKEKPNCYDYMLPLVQELQEISERKGNITMNIENKDYKFKPLITHCAVDLPAKSLLQETKQYGSYDGCTYCEIPGELIVIENSKMPKKKKNKNIMNKKKGNNKKANNKANENQSNENKFVRYVEGNGPYQLRDEVETLQKMLAASSSTSNKAVDGIKDVSCLVCLEGFNIISSIGVEYMHDCLLGGTKRIFNFFCNSEFSGKTFYIPPKKRKELSDKIVAIKPTANIVRKPRSLDQRKNFKASEYRSMLLYYLPVCLPGCVPDKIVQHVRLLSAAVYTLLKDSIPYEEVDNAEIMLDKFVKEHQVLFGKVNMVMVIHLLQHLSESVRQLGPLWCHSAFPFERNNGCLLKKVNGTTDVLHQMSTKYALSKSLSKKTEMTTPVAEKTLLGKGVDIVEKSLKVLNLESLKIFNFSNVTITIYKRIKLEKVIYNSLMYTRPKKSIDYFIGLKNDTIGMARFYFKHDGKIFVVMNEFEVIDNIYHISKVQRTNSNVMAPIDQIEKKYIFMKVGLQQYITCPPNPYENE